MFNNPHIKHINLNGITIEGSKTLESVLTTSIKQSTHELSSVFLQDQCLSQDTLVALFEKPHMKRLDLTGIIDVTSRKK